MEEYTLEQKMAGEDLHGLPCRVPEPTPEQAQCDHTEFQLVDNGYYDAEDAWVPNYQKTQVCTLQDIPGTNNMRCTKCGYTRRY